METSSGALSQKEKSTVFCSQPVSGPGDRQSGRPGSPGAACTSRAEDLVETAGSQDIQNKQTATLQVPLSAKLVKTSG